MRILVDARGLLEKELAGIEHYTYFLLKNLKRMYPGDEYILFSYSRSRRPNPVLARLFEWRHFEWSNLWMLGQNYFFNHPQIDRLFAGIDLVWFPNIRYMPVSPRVPKVMTIHDLSSVLLPDCYSWQRQLWHRYMESKWNLSSFAGLVAVSQNTADDIARTYNIPAEKIKVIYSGVPAIQASSDPELIRQKFNLPADYHVFVSTIEPRKNVRLLAQLFARLQCQHPGRYNLVVLGAAGWERPDLFDYINCQSNIIYPGYVTTAEKNAIITGARSLLYPSFYEGFGFPPLEAMSLGVPVVSSHAGSLGEILDEDAILIDPHDQNLLQEVVVELNDREWRQNQIVTRGLSRSDRFKWSEAAGQLREWFTYLSGDSLV